jgi:hypothetical protein
MDREEKGNSDEGVGQQVKFLKNVAAYPHI